MDQIKIATWQRLFDAAESFRKLAPWRWMREIDLFAVRPPESEEIGYCCVLGGGEEHFALNVYRGTRGLNGLMAIWQQSIDDPMDLLTFQDCLVAGFENRDMLDKEDLQIIKKCGRQYRGKNNWPIFRDYKPGYHPWFLGSEEDAWFLIHALEQGADICRKYKNQTDVFASKDYREFLSRMSSPTPEGPQWEEQWLLLREEDLEREEKISPILYNQIKVQQLSKTCPSGDQTWQTGFFIMREAIADRGERPYFPHVFLFIDEDSELIIHFTMSHPARYKQDFINALLEAVEKTGRRPREIRFTDEMLVEMAQPVLQEMEILSSVLEEEAAVDRIFGEMMEAA